MPEHRCYLGCASRGSVCFPLIVVSCTQVHQTRRRPRCALLCFAPACRTCFSRWKAPLHLSERDCNAWQPSGWKSRLQRPCLCHPYTVWARWCCDAQETTPCRRGEHGASLASGARVDLSTLGSTESGKRCGASRLIRSRGADYCSRRAPCLPRSLGLAACAASSIPSCWRGALPACTPTLCLLSRPCCLECTV